MPYATYDSSPPPTQTDTDPPPPALTKTLTLVTPRGEPRAVMLRDQRIRDGEVQLFRFTNDDRLGSLVLRR